MTTDAIQSTGNNFFNMTAEYAQWIGEGIATGASNTWDGISSAATITCSEISKFTIQVWDTTVDFVSDIVEKILPYLQDLGGWAKDHAGILWSFTAGAVCVTAIALTAYFLIPSAQSETQNNNNPPDNANNNNPPDNTNNGNPPDNANNNNPPDNANNGNQSPINNNGNQGRSGSASSSDDDSDSEPPVNTLNPDKQENSLPPGTPQGSQGSEDNGKTPQNQTQSGSSSPKQAGTPKGSQDSEDTPKISGSYTSSSEGSDGSSNNQKTGLNNSPHFQEDPDLLPPHTGGTETPQGNPTGAATKSPGASKTLFGNQNSETPNNSTKGAVADVPNGGRRTEGSNREDAQNRNRNNLQGTPRKHPTTSRNGNNGKS